MHIKIRESGLTQLQYVMYDSKYWFNLREAWSDFPTQSMNGKMKWYYLVQFSFWIQQILVVNIEEKRKDYAQMFTHHIVTCILIFCSYGFYQTKIGNVIMCIMDIVDIILPASFPRVGVFLCYWPLMLFDRPLNS